MVGLELTAGRVFALRVGEGQRGIAAGPSQALVADKSQVLCPGLEAQRADPAPQTT